MARVGGQNGQTWLRQLIVALVEDGVFPVDAVAILDRVPKN